MHNGKAYYIKVTAQQDGTFTVTNTRNNFSKTYRPGGINATNNDHGPQRLRDAEVGIPIFWSLRL